MTNLRAKSALRLGTVSKSVSRCPNEGFLQFCSIIPLSASRSGSCQCGSIFNLDPLKRGGRLSEIDEFESKKSDWGDVLTVLLTLLGETHDLCLRKRDSRTIHQDIADQNARNEEGR